MPTRFFAIDVVGSMEKFGPGGENEGIGPNLHGKRLEKRGSRSEDAGWRQLGWPKCVSLLMSRLLKCQRNLFYIREISYLRSGGLIQASIGFCDKMIISPHHLAFFTI